ncbi:MAG: hypothetical protein ACFFDI_02535 [Promethearchaeota archaeon]
MKNISQKEDICGIEGCENSTERSISSAKITNALTKEGLKLKPTRKRKIRLCRPHYRALRRHIKKESRLDRLRY